MLHLLCPMDPLRIWTTTAIVLIVLLWPSDLKRYFETAYHSDWTAHGTETQAPPDDPNDDDRICPVDPILLTR
jgi:hypothetical protein